MNTIINSLPGHFYCYTHLADLPLEKQSFDERYCWDCCNLLQADADELRSINRIRKQWWIPKKTPTKQSDCQKEAIVTNDTIEDTVAKIVTDKSARCSTCNTLLVGYRADARFCCSDCRVKFYRQMNKQMVLV